MTEITPEQAQLARASWILHGSSKKAGVQVSEATLQKMALAMREFMQEERLFFESQQRVDDAIAAIEAAH